MYDKTQKLYKIDWKKVGKYPLTGKKVSSKYMISSKRCKYSNIK